MRNAGGATILTRAAGIESPRRCTPCAPAASATSTRSLTRTRARVPRTASTQRSTSRVSGARREIALSHLDEMHAGPRRRTHALDERLFPVAIEPQAIRNHADDGPHVSLRPRATGRSRGGGPFHMARDEDREELDDARRNVDHAESGHRAADVVVRDDRIHQWQRLGEVIAVPERRPGYDDQHEANLEEQRHQQQPAHAPRLPAWMRESCTTRWRTSR